MAARIGQPRVIEQHTEEENVAVDQRTYDLFAACPPGLEGLLASELSGLGAARIEPGRGGVGFAGGPAVLARVNLCSRYATRVLVRLAVFRAVHLAQLDKRSRRVAWADWIAARTPVRVRASCHRSRIYHSGAAAERVAKALADGSGARLVRAKGTAAVEVLVRLDDDLCTLSLDSSGEPLWHRGAKREVAQAPLRENLAAAALGLAGYDGGEALLDPMCGSGTFVLEAASIALDRAPGRDRGFAFEAWPGRDSAVLAAERERAKAAERDRPAAGLFASDSAAAAVGMARRNLERAGLSEWVALERRPVADLEPPAERGLWICNPPYGRRLGRAQALTELYATLGRVFTERFAGWRLALLTTGDELAEATGLDLRRVGPILPHGGLKLRLFKSAG